MIRTKLAFLSLCLLSVALVGCKNSAESSRTTAKSDRKGPESTRPTPRETPQSLHLKSELLREIKHGGFYDQYLMFSPDGTYLASWLPEKLAVYEVSTGKPVGEVPQGRLPLAFSSDGTTFYTVGEKGLESWSCPGLKAKKATKEPGADSGDGAWKKIEWANGVKSLAGNGGRIYNFPVESTEYPVSPYSLAHTPDGEVVAYSMGAEIAVTTPKREKKPWTSPSVGRSITSVVLTEDGKIAVTGGMSGAFAIINLEKRKVVFNDRIPGEIRCIALAGRTLAVGCGDGMPGVAVIDAQTQTPLAVLEPESANVWGLAMTKDGKTLAAGGDDGVIRLFSLSLETGQK